MGKKLDVKFLDKFAYGNANTNYFVDLPNFTLQQVNALAKFIEAAQTGAKFSGKNKPSNYFPKSGGTVASYNGLRHCHLEPYSHKTPTLTTYIIITLMAVVVPELSTT